MTIRLLLVGAADVVNGRFSEPERSGEIKRMSEFIKELSKNLTDIGREILETAKHKAKISTLFDIFTEKVIPTFVSEKDLKEYYEKRMEEVNEFIYKL